MAGLAGLCAALPPGHEPRWRLSKAVSDGAPKMEEPVESIRLTVVPAAPMVGIDVSVTRKQQHRRETGHKHCEAHGNRHCR